MELLAAALVVVVVVEAMLLYRFKRRADLLKEAMERDRATFMRQGHPAPKGRPPEPTVGATAGKKPSRPVPGEGEHDGEEEPSG